MLKVKNVIGVLLDITGILTALAVSHVTAMPKVLYQVCVVRMANVSVKV